MKRINKKLVLMFAFVFCVMFMGHIYAASASISANKTKATVGDSVKVTVTVKAAAWNLGVSGSATGSIIGYNDEGVNQTVTKTYTISTSNAGTYTVYLTGDITDENDTNTDINKSVTITVNKKETTTNNTTTNKNNTTTNTTTNKNNTNKNNNTTTTTKKSSNANLSKITLGVEGLSFNKSQTTYNVKVGEDVDKLTMSVTTEDSKATYTITGNKDFKAGVNVVKIIVTAEDGTTKTYKINVEKEGNIEESSSALVNLIIENMKFTEDFSKTVTEYIGSNMKYTEKLNILPYTEAEEATYEIIGNENLKEGENEIIIKVTSKDKSTTTEYKVKFDMLSLEETNNMVSSENVNIYAENNKVDDTNWKTELWNTVKENATIILLYFLALIEFLQVVYLYTKLKEVNPDEVTIKRRKKNK